MARGAAWTDVEHVWRQWVFADWANGSNHENAQITETLNKGALITADLGNKVDHKSLVDVPTHWYGTTIIDETPQKMYIYCLLVPPGDFVISPVSSQNIFCISGTGLDLRSMFKNQMLMLTWLKLANIGHLLLQPSHC